MHCRIQDKVHDLLERSWNLCLAPLLIFDQLGGLIDTRLVECLQE